jgi:hypothetical protein
MGSRPGTTIRAPVRAAASCSALRTSTSFGPPLGSSPRRRETQAPTCSKMRRRSSWKTTTSTSTSTAKKAWKIAAVSPRPSWRAAR